MSRRSGRRPVGDGREASRTAAEEKRRRKENYRQEPGFLLEKQHVGQDPDANGDHNDDDHAGQDAAHQCRIQEPPCRRLVAGGI